MLKGQTSDFSFSAFQLFSFYFVGDPTVLGWTTFALYLLASACCFRRALIRRPVDRVEPVDPGNEPARVWRALAVILLLLGLNKQLDLQTPLTKLGRRLSMASDLYASRRVIQVIFLAGLLFILGLVIARFSKTLRHFAREHPLAGTGAVLVGIYVLIRAISIEHVDRLLGFDLDEVAALGFVELLGIILVIVETVLKTEKLKS